MGFQSQLVLGGVVLLIVAVTLKVMVMRTPVQRGPVAFIILWASLAACHFWQSGQNLVLMIPGGVGSEEMTSLAGFWLVFALALLPGVFMIHSWMRNWEPLLPFWFERVIGIGSPVLVVLMLGAHLMMSAQVAVPQVRQLAAADSVPGRLVQKGTRLSLNAYLHVASRVCGMSPKILGNDRVPSFVIQSFSQKPSKASPSPESSSEEVQP